jgi:hypothetical protein
MSKFGTVLNIPSLFPAGVVWLCGSPSEVTAMRSQDLHERQHQCLLFALVLSHFQPTEEQKY